MCVSCYSSTYEFHMQVLFLHLRADFVVSYEFSVIVVYTTLSMELDK